MDHSSMCIVCADLISLFENYFSHQFLNSFVSVFVRLFSGILPLAYHLCHVLLTIIISKGK